MELWKFCLKIRGSLSEGGRGVCKLRREVEQTKFIFRADCNSTKFGLPYLNHQQANIIYKYAGIYASHQSSLCYI